MSEEERHELERGKELNAQLAELNLAAREKFGERWFQAAEANRLRSHAQFLEMFLP